MATKKLEKKEELGTTIQLGAIINNANKKKNIEKEVKTEEKNKIYRISMRVPLSLWEEFSNSYYELVRELGKYHLSITRSEAFMYLIYYMDKVIEIDVSKYPNFYEEYIGYKGKRFTNERTIEKNEKTGYYCWASFNYEQTLVWKRVLTKLGIKEGFEKSSIFSKQYFMIDIIKFFSENLDKLIEEIKKEKI